VDEELRRFRELEQAELSAGATVVDPTVVDSDEQAAREFADRLREEARLPARAVLARVPSREDDEEFWTIRVPPGSLFALEILHRHYQGGVRPKELTARPAAEKLRVLTDLLASRAILAGGWRTTPCRADELAWYRGFAGVSAPQIERAVERARAEVRAHHAAERRLSGWLALGFGAAAVAAFALLGVHWTAIGAAAVAVGLLAFHLVRRRSPQGARRGGEE
jgi:hypothetical protein